MSTMYVIYQASMSGPDALQSGETISRHRTIEAMVAHERAALKRLRRQAGVKNACYDWHFAAEDNGPHGDRRELTREEYDRAIRAYRQ